MASRVAVSVHYELDARWRAFFSTRNEIQIPNSSERMPYSKLVRTLKFCGTWLTVRLQIHDYVQTISNMDLSFCCPTISVSNPFFVEEWHPDADEPFLQMNDEKVQTAEWKSGKLFSEFGPQRLVHFQECCKIYIPFAWSVTLLIITCSSFERMNRNFRLPYEILQNAFQSLHPCFQKLIESCRDAPAPIFATGYPNSTDKELNTSADAKKNHLF